MGRRAALAALAERIGAEGGTEAERAAAALALSNIFGLGDLWLSLIGGVP